jgi:FixJ family two-component response regulator
MPRLTPRQDDVLWEVVKGSPIKKIAEQLHIEGPSVQDHLEDIERRFADAGYPIREEGETIRDRRFRLAEKAKEIGYFTRKTKG